MSQGGQDPKKPVPPPPQVSNIPEFATNATNPQPPKINFSYQSQPQQVNIGYQQKTQNSSFPVQQQGQQ